MKQNLKTTKAPDIKSKAEGTRQDDVAQSTEQQNRRTEQQTNGISQQPDTIKHILVIDDDATMLRLIKEQLKEEYNIATAISGKIGLKFLERKQTDLILLDYEMPEMNGADVLETLRNNPQTKDIPVLFLTGTKERKKIQRALSLKPQGYLLKPIKAEQLSREIKKVIG